MKKEPGIFDTKKLEGFVNQAPSEYAIRHMDRQGFVYCQRENWSRDLVSQFPEYESYQRTGLGVLMTRDGIPVSEASSYSAYLGGIEIDTKEECRRRGLALACGPKLILECLDRGLYPSWGCTEPEAGFSCRKAG